MRVVIFTPESRVSVPPVMRVFLIVALLAGLSAGPAAAEDPGGKIAAAAHERTQHQVVYDPAYVRLAYPMGDVATDRGVCSDVVVRSLRALGVDLQRLMHEDMTSAFNAYPALWGLTAPDANIDHRRVVNIETYLTRKGLRLPDSEDAADFMPGDIVAWNLKGASGGFLAHIGIVSDTIGPSGAPMVVHNIGKGTMLEDVLFAWPMTGRFRLTEDYVAAAAAPAP